MKKIIAALIVFSLMFSCNTNNITEAQKKEIIAELDAINVIDQQFAGLPPDALTKKYGHSKSWEIFEIQRDSVGLINQNKIKKLYKKYGYLGYKEVGEKASHNFWISIQHADNDVAFQQEMLKALKVEIEKDNAGKVEYAMLEDRVNINLNKKQRFGTQVTYNKFGQAIPKNGLIDSLQIEQLRKDFGLPTFLEYYNGMTTNHFEMNKKIMLEAGITAPKLYK